MHYFTVSNAKITKWFLLILVTGSSQQIHLFAQESSIERQLKSAKEASRLALFVEAQIYAPGDFSDAWSLFAEAQNAIKNREDAQEISRKLTQARRLFDQAIKIARESKPLLSEVVMVRKKLLQHNFINQFSSEKLLEAERIFQRAIAAGESGNLDQAGIAAEKLLQVYRQALINATESGPINTLEFRLDSLQENGEFRNLGDARKKLTSLKALLPTIPDQSFDVITFSETLFKSLAELERTLEVPETLAPEPCPDPVQPMVLDVDISAPAPGDVLEHDPIYYVSGNILDIDITLPQCTYVSAISIGDRPLPPESDPIEGGGGRNYELINLTTLSESTYSVTVRMYLDNSGFGISGDVRIDLISRKGNLASAYEFTMVTVKHVNLSKAILMTISEADMRNNLILGLYDKYGVDGRYTDPLSDLHLRDPDYENMELKFEDGTIFFKLSVDKEIGNQTIPLPDPTITVSGRFHLEFDNNDLVTVWDKEPGMGVPIVDNYISPSIKQEIETQLQPFRDQLGQFITNPGTGDQAPLPAYLFLNVNIRNDKLNVELDQDVLRLAFLFSPEPYSSITIDVPYQTHRLMNRRPGLALNPNDQVMILSGGLVRICGRNGYFNPSCQINTGTDGLMNVVPLPHWASATESGYWYSEQLLKVWKTIQYIPRDEDELPAPSANTGVLLARLENGISSSALRLLNSPCTITARSVAQDRLVIGPNDYAKSNGEQGSGMREVTIVFPPNSVQNAGCQTATGLFAQPVTVTVQRFRITMSDDSGDDNQSNNHIGEFYMQVNNEYLRFPQRGEADIAIGEWIELPESLNRIAIDVNRNAKYGLNITMQALLGERPAREFSSIWDIEKLHLLNIFQEHQTSGDEYPGEYKIKSSKSDTTPFELEVDYAIEPARD